MKAQWLDSRWQALKGSDWREVGAWPAVAHWGLVGVVFWMTLALGWFAFILPAQEELAQAQRQSQQLKAQFNERLAQWHAAQDLQQQAQALEQRVQALERQLPKATELPSLMLALDQLAVEHHLQFEGLKPGSEHLENGLMEVPIQMRLNGRWVDVASFCAAVARLPRIVILNHWTLSRTTPASDERLLWTVRASTYRFVGPSS